MRRRNCCHVTLAFVLKLLNFLEAFVGICIVVYSVWMLNQWIDTEPYGQPPVPAPSPGAPIYSFSSVSVLESAYSDDYRFAISSLRGTLPAAWFLYSLMGIGIILCCVNLVGCIAAESFHRCCLWFFIIIKVTLILLEVALVAFVAIDHQWEKDIPNDPTGEIERLWSFIVANADLLKVAGITIIAIQFLALVFSALLLVCVSYRRNDFDSDDDYENPRRTTREPLLIQSGRTSSSAPSSDFWNSRIREKYGLFNSDRSKLPNSCSSSVTKNL